MNGALPMKRKTTTCPSCNVVLENSVPHKNQGRKRKTSMSPSESIIRNLLSYSKALSVIKSKEIGTLNLVMN